VKIFNLLPPTEYQIQISKLFAKYSVGTSLDKYAERSQNDVEKITLDIFNGKVCEYMVYNTMLSKGKKLSRVDIEIYDAKNKTFDADFTLNGYNFHVKSHFVNGNFPVSWLFQNHDSLVTNPTENDYIIFCEIHNLEHPKNTMYMVNAKNVNYELPIKDVLKKTKVCVYKNTLLNG